MDIQLNIKEQISSTDKQLCIEVLENIVDSLKEQFALNIDNLSQIIITDNFENELVELSNKTRLKENISFTNETYATAFAKIIPIFVNEKFTNVIVLRMDWFQYYVNEDTKYFAINILHHELSHIDDYNNKLLHVDGWMTQKLTLLQMHYFPYASRAWDEFYANYKSSLTADNYVVNIAMENFKNGLENFDEMVLHYKYKYQTRLIDLNTFLELLNRHGVFLFHSAAYVIGYCKGLNRSLDELSSEITTILSSHQFRSIYEEMEETLNNMLLTYPNEWKDVNALNNICDVFLNYYHQIGVRFREIDKDGEKVVRVDVN